MAITIDEEIMTGSGTTHQATRIDEDEHWSVSWLPGRIVSRSQAITAMVIADMIRAGRLHDDRTWQRIGYLARELGLTAAQASAAVNAYATALNATAKERP